MAVWNATQACRAIRIDIAQISCTTSQISWYFLPGRDWFLLRAPAQSNVQSLPFPGDSSPFLPETKHSFISPKMWKRFLLKNPLWQLCTKIQFCCLRKSHIICLFGIFMGSKIQHSAIARPLKSLSKPWTSQSFPASQQKSRCGQKMWKAESRSTWKQGQGFLGSTKSEAGAI